MPTPVRILVMNVGNDGALTPSTDAQVVVGRRDLLGDSSFPHADLLQTHFESGGHYLNISGDPKNEPDAGEWLLVVRAKDKATVVQRLTFSTKDDVIRAAAGWGGVGGAGQTAATVSIANYVEAKEEVDADRPKQSVLTVKLFPAVHFVALACVQSDATFDLFSLGRRDRLFELGKLNPGSHAHLISTRRQVTEVFVKSQKPAVTSWVKVAELTPQGAGEKNGILELYGVLQQLGTDQPGTVIEAAYFGHGWHAGPVVRNTSDNGSDLLTRDPLDFDGRPKDWHPRGTLANQFPKLKDALRSDGRFFMAGCSHMVNVINECRAANKQAKDGTARDVFYKAPMRGGHVHTTLDYTKRAFGQFVQATFFNRSDINGVGAGHATYIGLAAQTLGCEVFGAPPGAEANLGRVRGNGGVNHQTMTVLARPNTENISVISYYEREFSTFERDDIGYASYTKMLSETLPELGWHTERHAIFEEWEWGKLLRLPSGLLVRRQQKNGAISFPVARKEGPLSGHLYVLPRALPKFVALFNYLDGRVQKTLITRDDPNRDMGLFVTTAGQTLLRIRDRTGSDFVVADRQVPAIVMEFRPGEAWRVPEPPNEIPQTIGEIERVPPKWYW